MTQFHSRFRSFEWRLIQTFAIALIDDVENVRPEFLFFQRRRIEAQMAAVK
jgi:hypothetical protein